MSRRRSFEVASLVAVSSLVAFGAVVAACGDDAASPTDTPDATTPTPREAGQGGQDGGVEEDSATPEDGGAEASKDAGRDVNGPGEAGAECVLNYDCQLALRCECEGFACTCKPGARGTGKNGVDPCDEGNDCVSSLCVEGPPDSGDFCSDECTTNADCTGKLPQCTTIAGLGRVCVRTTP